MRILNKLGLTAVSAAMLTTTLIVPQTSEAVPAFARQVGMGCTACHTNFPALNSFGRAFKSTGYTMQGAAPMLTGEDFSLPSNLNASVINKVRYRMGSNDATAGEIQWPDEAAMLVGGRGTENMGYLLEIQLGGVPVAVEGHTSTTANADGSYDFEGEGDGNSYAGAKFHFNVNDNFAVIPYSTDGLGVGYAFELMNTGVARPQRAIENRKGYSATNKLDLDGAATGVAVVYHTNDMFVHYSHWAPGWGHHLPAEAKVLGGLAHYVRAAYMPRIGDWDMGFGAALMTGEATINTDGTAAGEAKVKTESTVLDFQMIGEIAGKPAEVYVTYGTVPSNSNGNVFGKAGDQTAMGALFVHGAGQGLSYHVAMMNYTLDGSPTSDYTSFTLGATYYFAQNVRLEAFHENFDNTTEDYTMLQLTLGL